MNDSSLVDEVGEAGRRQKTPQPLQPSTHSIEEEKPPAVTKNLRAFRVMVRNASSAVWDFCRRA